MKATGIVRRIDDYVIIRTRSENLENTGVSLILSNFANIVNANCMTAVRCRLALERRTYHLHCIPTEYPDVFSAHRGIFCS